MIIIDGCEIYDEFYCCLIAIMLDRFGNDEHAHLLNEKAVLFFYFN